jgi:hypothetical protein
VIKNDPELRGTLERIQYFYRIIINLRTTETNPANYKASAGGFLAEIARMNLEVREYLALHPSEVQEEELLPTGTR